MFPPIQLIAVSSNSKLYTCDSVIQTSVASRLAICTSFQFSVKNSRPCRTRNSNQAIAIQLAISTYVFIYCYQQVQWVLAMIFQQLIISSLKYRITVTIQQCSNLVQQHWSGIKNNLSISSSSQLYYVAMQQFSAIALVRHQQ